MTRLRKVLPTMILIAGLLPLVILTESSAATTFTVTRADDPAPNGCKTNDCSLREAVRAANAKAGGDVIALKSDTYVLSIVGTGENASATGDLDIKGPLKIVGKGASQSIVDADEIDRAFHVFNGIEVEFSKLTITNGSGQSEDGGAIWNRGKLTLRKVVVSNNTSTSVGGAILNRGPLTIIDSRIRSNTLPTTCCGGAIYNEKKLTISNSRIDHNTAVECCGGAIYNTEGADMIVKGSQFDHNSVPECCGGAIYSEDEGTTVMISNSVFSANSAPDCCGGAIYNDSGSKMTIKRSKIVNNTADSCCGAGIYNDSAPLTVSDTLFKGNDGGSVGGGIHADGGNVKILRSTFTDNSADQGGAIQLQDGNLTLTNSTISGNHATLQGAGLFTQAGTVNITNSTITDNDAVTGAGGIYAQAGTFNVVGSIVGANTPSDCGPSTLGGGRNLDSDSTCFTGGSAIHANPRLAVLGKNGGPTPTHPLKATSKAVDAMGASACPPPKTDQRKVKRPKDGDGNGIKRCDLGSFERK